MDDGGRIEQLDCYSYRLSYAHGTYVMSRQRRITTLESTVVALRCSDGATGYGEVCPLGPAYLPAHAAGARAAVAELAPAVVGAAATNAGALQLVMDEALAGHGYAKSAIVSAAIDLQGKRRGVSACELLGGRLAGELPLYVAVPLGPAEEMVRFVLEQRRLGIHRFQLKLGAAPHEDVERVQAVVEATGPGDVVVADANGGWRLADAVEAARQLERMPRVRLEQPCPSLEECLQVRRRTSLPMILDEVVVDVQALLRAVAERACEGVNLKVSRVGGLGRARLLRDLCAELGVALTIEDSWGGDLSTAAVAALGGSTPPEALYAVSFMNDWTLEHVGGYEPRSANGRGPVPDAPGLGLDVEEKLLGEPLFSLTAPLSARRRG